MSQFLAPRLHFGLAARSCKQNMYDDDEANISFHFEATSNLFGHRREAGFMDKKMMHAFVFSPPLHFTGTFSFVGFYSLLFTLKGSHKKHQEHKSFLPKYACLCILWKTFPV